MLESLKNVPYIEREKFFSWIGKKIHLMIIIYLLACFILFVVPGVLGELLDFSSVIDYFSDELLELKNKDDKVVFRMFMWMVYFLCWIILWYAIGELFFPGIWERLKDWENDETNK